MKVSGENMNNLRYLSSKSPLSERRLTIASLKVLYVFVLLIMFVSYSFYLRLL